MSGNRWWCGLDLENLGNDQEPLREKQVIRDAAVTVTTQKKIITPWRPGMLRVPLMVSVSAILGNNSELCAIESLHHQIECFIDAASNHIEFRSVVKSC